ncbi:MAG: polysaccharide pyruvyl transferase family protein [Solirubrobacteraceae bacterium]|nr:polysaccharide pyruvyl transferase family protein [Solirubrobacteraceae bacterium]
MRPRRFNVGNETINVATRGLLRQAFGSSLNLVPIPAQKSDEEGSLSGMTAQTTHEMNRFARGVVVGGGNLYENGQLDLDPHALTALRPPMLLLSLSYGRIFDDRGRLHRRTDAMPDHQIQALHRASSGALVRDTATLDHVRSLGIHDAELGGCPTLFLDELLPTPPAPSARISDAPVLLSIRNPSLMSVPPGDQARLHGELRRMIDALESRGLAPVHLLCHDKRDLEFASSLPDVPHVLPDDVYDYLSLLQAAQLVVSFRLHAFVPCLSLGIPAINISYDERSASLTDTIGLSSWDVPYLAEPDLTAAVMDRVDRLDELPSLVDDARPTWESLRAVTARGIDQFSAAVTDYTDTLARL